MTNKTLISDTRLPQGNESIDLNLKQPTRSQSRATISHYATILGCYVTEVVLPHSRLLLQGVFAQ